ncbi:MAG: helix-turn-helix domain-containing protein [Muribaculaceae bacterium]|nr:helix-turn-helix domain-containing protein [Muribaculaceae bacterium]
MVKDENYYTVFGWMRNRLHLKGNDLIVYALIYSFSQDGESEFKGSLSYITDFTGASRRTIISTLASLEERGLITKDDKNSTTGRPNTYKAVPLDEIEVCKNSTPPAQISHSPVGKNSTPPAQISHPIIISDNNSSTLTVIEERKKESRKEGSNKQRRSYNDVLDTFGIKEGTERRAIFEFIRHCQLNGKTLTDDALIRTLDNLHTYGTEAARIGAIHSAIDKGEYTIAPKPELHYDIFGSKSCYDGKSYQEVIDSRLFGFDDRVKSAIWDFIRHCQANGQKMTNDRLANLCSKLKKLYRSTEVSEMVEALNTAINRGYYDIKDGEGWIAQIARFDRESGIDRFGGDAE